MQSQTQSPDMHSACAEKHRTARRSADLRPTAGRRHVAATRREAVYAHFYSLLTVAGVAFLAVVAVLATR